MKKLYNKNEILFSLIWIGLYVVIMNIALQFCGGFDNLKDKTVIQVLVPVICIILLAAFCTVWIIKNGFLNKYGLCSFKGNHKVFLFFLPLALMSCVNLISGFDFSNPASLTILMSINLAVGGYVEEIIFRGFLFRAMAKDNLKSAIIVSAVTFGVGHIVNVFNTADILGVFLQICYAIVIGFLYTIIVLKGQSLWPCIISHAFVNATSVFAHAQGPVLEIISSVFIILLSGSYALWLWKKS